jgi:hypothetical protein
MHVGRAKCNQQRAADDVPRRTGNEQTSTETPSVSRSGDLPMLSWNVPEWPYDLNPLLIIFCRSFLLLDSSPTLSTGVDS